MGTRPWVARSSPHVSEGGEQGSEFLLSEGEEGVRIRTPVSGRVKTHLVSSGPQSLLFLPHQCSYEASRPHL